MKKNYDVTKKDHYSGVLHPLLLQITNLTATSVAIKLLKTPMCIILLCSGVKFSLDMNSPFYIQGIDVLWHSHHIINAARLQIDVPWSRIFVQLILSSLERSLRSGVLQIEQHQHVCLHITFPLAGKYYCTYNVWILPLFQLYDHFLVPCVLVFMLPSHISLQISLISSLHQMQHK